MRMESDWSRRYYFVGFIWFLVWSGSEKQHLCVPAVVYGYATGMGLSAGIDWVLGFLVCGHCVLCNIYLDAHNIAIGLGWDGLGTSSYW